MEDKINEIVSKAIPKEDCAVKESRAKWRRERLKEAIKELVRDKSKPFNPITEYKNANA